MSLHEANECEDRPENTTDNPKSWIAWKRRAEAAAAERDAAIRERDLWFKTHLSHRDACDALGKANGEMFKRALEAERRVESRQAQLRGIRESLEASDARATALEAALVQCRKQLNAIIEDGIPTDFRAWRDDIDAALTEVP
jgi:hypothetical protein